MLAPVTFSDLGRMKRCVGPAARRDSEILLYNLQGNGTWVLRMVAQRLPNMSQLQKVLPYYPSEIPWIIIDGKNGSRNENKVANITNIMLNFQLDNINCSYNVIPFMVHLWLTTYPPFYCFKVHFSQAWLLYLNLLSFLLLHYFVSSNPEYLQSNWPRGVQYISYCTLQITKKSWWKTVWKYLEICYY